ncbi:hypothetical protein ScPMuIL_009339 [Solemya velum]
MLGGSFGRSFFDDMEKDPFFKIPQHTRRQQDMFDNMLGFGQTDRHHGQLNQTETNEKRAVAPFSMFDEDFGFENMFGRMRNMMSSMEKQFTAARNNQDTNCFSQSSIMTYSKDGERPPKFYKAAISTRTAPGGIKEVKKAEHDSERGVQKMAIGHHIRDRGHVRERLHNTKTGYKNEDQNFINLNESEAEQFHREWDEKTRQYTRGDWNSVDSISNWLSQIQSKWRGIAWMTTFMMRDEERGTLTENGTSCFQVRFDMQY